jgi:hypothetical protein
MLLWQGMERITITQSVQLTSPTGTQFQKKQRPTVNKTLQTKLAV